MSRDSNFYRAAKLIINQHGDNAEGAATWLPILNSTVELLTPRQDGERLH